MEVMVVGGAWRLEHEDLHGDAAGVIAGTQIDALSFRNHGTAMLGVVRADRNSFGVTGVAPACRARQVATFGLGTAAAINAAAEALPAGGILLVEWQRPGPGATGVGSAGFIALEWWPDDFAAIKAATAKGVIVVVPAGNGGVSLDDPRYSQPAPGFPPTWRNPFDRTQADSGSIMVGAGAPPAEHARPRPRGRAITARVLQLRPVRRRAGLGGGGHDARLRRPARRRRVDLVHGRVRGHVGRGRDRRRRHRPRFRASTSTVRSERR